MPGVEDWQGKVGQTWADEWRRTDRSFSEMTPQLVNRILENDFNRALDIGCGAGELSLLVARERPASRVMGVDVNPSLIDIAKDRGADQANANFAVQDASTVKADDGEGLQAMFSRHGVMFFDDPVAAFANLRASAAQAGARITFSCFRELADNPFFTQIGALLPISAESPDPHAPGPFAFADKDRVAGILAQAGWRDVGFERIDFQMIAGGGEDPIADAVGYFSRIGPAARALAVMDREDRPAVRDRIAELASRNVADGQVKMRASVWIVTASSG